MLWLAGTICSATVGIVDFKVTAVKPDTPECFNSAVEMPRAAAEPGSQMAWWVVAMTYKHSLWNRVWPDKHARR